MISSKGFEILYPNEVSRNLYNSNDRQCFFKSDYFREYFINKIDETMRSVKTPIISCDIFDTILFRNNKSEPFRFFEISKAINENLKLDKNIYEVFLARYLGTEITYSASKIVHGCREGSLYDIHQVLLNALNVSSDKINESIISELEYEKNNITLNVGLWDILKELKDSNKIKVIFISDTYKHDVHIKELLNYFIPEYNQYVDKIYSSADTTISKHSMHLFDYVRNDLKCSAESLFHIGDNLHSDYQNARKKDWNSMFLPIPKYQQEEIRKNLVEFKEKLDNDGIRVKLIDRLFAGEDD